MLSESIAKLVQYGIETGLTPACEKNYTTNLLLDIFKEHHVDIITASDAHKPADVGTCIKDIYKLCQYD